MASRHVDDYDDDGLDDNYDEEDYGEGEDELSPEDRAAMTHGTAEVKKAMGQDFAKVTLKQVEDALWHYYYDVDKSVAYLKKTYVTPQPQPPSKPAPKKMPEGMSTMLLYSDPSALPAGQSWADQQRSVIPETKLGYEENWAPSASENFPIMARPHLPLEAYFTDMPWLNVPQDRQAIFIAPSHPRGGLLGGGEGGPPLSKLQLLAAARKKKSEEKKEKEKGKAESIDHDISKLSLAGEKQKENTKLVTPLAKRQKLSALPETTQTPAIIPSKDNEVETVVAAKTAASIFPPVKEQAPPETDVTSVVQKASPSAFARTLFGSAPDSKKRKTRDVFPMPYTSSASYSPGVFSEPSPDDIVLAAQAKAGKKAAPVNKAIKTNESRGNAARDDGAAAGLSNLQISDAPPPKSKGLDVVREFENSSSKRSVSFVVVGHVDAGKSTLMGRLLLELQHVDQRTVDKYRRQAEKAGKQSFALAWVMDQRSEERERGVTIDIATNFFETEQTKFTILDAPGHRDFVPNMIAGASQADFAILVIDANTGAYEKGLKGQTREHVLLLRSIGVQRVVVAVNKLDMVGYSKDRFEEITQEVTGFLSGLGFQDKNVAFVPISGLNGDNIVRPIADKAASWYTGSTLISALEDSGPSAARALRKPLRMAISEVFRSQQGTTTLSGRVDAGTMQVGDVLVVQPSGETAYIKSIMVDKDSQDWAVAGQNVSIALTNIDPVHIRVGDILCHPTDAIACGDSFTMKAMAFDHLLPSPVDLHRGRLHVPGRIQTIVASLDKSTGQIVKKKPKVVQPGEVARVVIKLEVKVPLESGQRVVIRSGGETVAAGLME